MSGNLPDLCNLPLTQRCVPLFCGFWCEGLYRVDLSSHYLSLRRAVLRVSRLAKH